MTQLVDALMDRHGTTYAEELGIDVAKGTPAPLWQLLAAALVFSTGLNHETTLRGARAVNEVRSPEAVAEAGFDGMREALHGARMQRTQQVARQLVDAADHAVGAYGGDLRRLREAAGGDAGQMSELLQEFKGIGPNGAEIFLREVQAAWPELRPYVDRRGKDGAKRLGLKVGELGDLAPKGHEAAFATALVRASFEDDVSELRALA